MTKLKKYFTTTELRKLGRAFNIVIGGRQTGKTFNGIYESVKEYNERIIYMRRTEDELITICKNDDNVDVSPFAKINKRSRECDWLKPCNFKCGMTNKHIAYIQESDKPVGMMLALSTVSKMRGIDAVDYDIMIYDEFIPEEHVRLLGTGDKEATAFFNACNTLIRDVEIIYNKKIPVYLFSNSNNIRHPILKVLGLVPIIERMIKKMGDKPSAFLDMPEKELTITLYNSSELQEELKNTSLAKLTRGTQFYDMAYNNKFAFNDFSNIRSIEKSKLVGLCVYGNCNIYEIKNSGGIYVSVMRLKGRPRFNNDEQGTINFNIEYGRLLYRYYSIGLLFFENYDLKSEILAAIL